MSFSKYENLKYMIIVAQIVKYLNGWISLTYYAHLMSLQHNNLFCRKKIKNFSDEDHWQISEFTFCFPISFFISVTLKWKNKFCLLCYSIMKCGKLRETECFNSMKILTSINVVTQNNIGENFDVSNSYYAKYS